ncbi:hypothetical protein AGLY_000069 [Aphis glycines]|uniref:Dynactin subunit 5 n=1 Tax=Aphis glycines TaxID=307491 RepID=A0A6G0U5Y6_APHGL|nr:hypothetical protein AGLY_000069 [Aphis glycines]
MELQDTFYSKSEYVETTTGNKVSRQAQIYGSQNIILNGKVILQSGVMIRGDLASVKMGRYCFVGRGSVVRPPCKKFSGGFTYFALQIGDHVHIGEQSVIQAAIIGSYVHIGKNVVIGKRCILKDCCMIGDNTVLAPDTVVPSFTHYSGSPGIQIGQLPVCTQDLSTDYTKSFYDHFVPFIDNL